MMKQLPSGRFHVADDSSRLTRFLRIERAQLPWPSTKRLQQRPASRNGNAMVRAFVKIERRGDVKVPETL